MNKLIKNKILLFHIFCFSPICVFAAEKNINNEQENISTQDEIARLKEENELLKLQMENKIIKLELEKRQKEEKETNNLEERDNEIKELQKELDLLHNKHNLFLAQQCDNDEFRQEVKNNLKLSNRGKKLDIEIEIAKKELALNELKIEKERIVSSNKVVYLDNPLLENGTLVISDRQVHMNNIITNSGAEQIEHDIDFFNNKDDKKPIFLMIDKCYGGNVIAGMRILNKIKNSQAPVYVVVRSFAASMAAIITTLAPKSFCLKDTVLMHHQPHKNYVFTEMNVREQEESLKEIKKIWERIEGPVAKKMGITLENFMKKMYEKNSHGDWSEYGDEAKKIKWVDDVVTDIRDTSVKMRFVDEKGKNKMIGGNENPNTLPFNDDFSNFVKEQKEFPCNNFCYVHIPEDSNLKLNFYK